MASLSRGYPTLIWVFAVVIGLLNPISPITAAENIIVVPDQALVVKIPPNVATIVIGNPLMADVAVPSAGLMVVTAKSYGITNVIMLDRLGKLLLERNIWVQSEDTGTVYNGVDRVD